jgi:hypothetical protein
MPLSLGPNVIDDSIIFNYDTGDTSNSWIGAPTTNLTAFNIATSGFSTDTSGNLTQTSNSSEATYQGRLSRKMVVGAGYWNAYIYSYNTGVSSANFAVSYKVKTSDGSHPNTIIGGGYIYGSAGSFFPAPTFTYVSDGWYLATMLYSGTSMTLNSLTGMNGSGGPKTFYIVDYQAEALPYSTTFTPAGTSRSVTQGLLDISSTGKSIDITNASFSSNNQITFDGTNDYIDVTTSLGTLSQYTIEHVSFKGSENRMPIAFRGGPVFYQYGDNSWYYTHGGTAGEYYYPKTKTISGWGHWVIVYTGSSVRIYRNGIYEGQQSTSGTANWGSGMRIGYWPYGGGYAWNGQIAIVKMYSRALNDSEVTNNYNQYKIRFNLS